MLVAAVAVAIATGMPGATASGQSEVRAIWVTRWDFRSASDVRRVLENCASVGLNRVYFQVRGRADAFYRSALEPWGEELGGGDPGFDPLAVALREAARLGLELHAWVNVLAGWKGKTPPRDPRHLVHVRPEWFLLDRSGKRHLLGSHYTMLNPCLPEVRSHIVKVLVDITQRYPIDGLHLDYIRFVTELFPDRQAVPYDSPTLARFRRLTGGFPSRYPERWDEFRRQAIDSLVEAIARGVRAVRPACRLSAAVVSDFERGRQLFLQDCVQWLARGWVSEVVPMNYRRDPDVFAYHTDVELQRAHPRAVIAGIGAHLLRRSKEMRLQVDATRRLGARGYAVFAYTSLFPSPSHASRTGAAARELRTELRAALRDLNSGGSRS